MWVKRFAIKFDNFFRKTPELWRYIFDCKNGKQIDLFQRKTVKEYQQDSKPQRLSKKCRDSQDPTDDA